MLTRVLIICCLCCFIFSTCAIGSQAFLVESIAFTGMEQAFYGMCRSLGWTPPDMTSAYDGFGVWLYNTWYNSPNMQLVRGVGATAQIITTVTKNDDGTSVTSLPTEFAEAVNEYCAQQNYPSFSEDGSSSLNASWYSDLNEYPFPSFTLSHTFAGTPYSASFSEGTPLPSITESSLLDVLRYNFPNMTNEELLALVPEKVIIRFYHRYSEMRIHVCPLYEGLWITDNSNNIRTLNNKAYAMLDWHISSNRWVVGLSDTASYSLDPDRYNDSVFTINNNDAGIILVGASSRPASIYDPSQPNFISDWVKQQFEVTIPERVEEILSVDDDTGDTVINNYTYTTYNQSVLPTYIPSEEELEELKKIEFSISNIGEIIKAQTGAIANNLSATLDFTWNTYLEGPNFLVKGFFSKLFGGIWHYVPEFFGSLGGAFSLASTCFYNLPYALRVTVYALGAISIIFGVIWRLI